MEGVNAACKCCRISRIKCDMMSQASGSCSRCTRLGLQCVPEQRRSSGKARLGSKCREMLNGDEPAPAPLVTALAAPLPADVHVDENTVHKGGDFAFISTICNAMIGKGLKHGVRAGVMGQGRPGVGVPVQLLEYMVRVMVEVARQRDHLGLMSYTMQRASELGLSLSRLIPFGKGESGPCGPRSPLQLTGEEAVEPCDYVPVPPPVVMDVFDAPHTACFVRIFARGQPFTMPNSKLRRWLAPRGVEAGHFDVPLKLLSHLESDAERHRMLQLLASHANETPATTEDGHVFIEVSDDVPFNLPFRAGEFDEIFGEGKEAEPSFAVPVSTVPPEPAAVVRELRNAWGVPPPAADMQLVPHIARLRLVKMKHPGAAFFCLCLTPAAAPQPPPPPAMVNAVVPAGPVALQPPPPRKRPRSDSAGAAAKRKPKEGNLRVSDLGQLGQAAALPMALPSPPSPLSSSASTEEPEPASLLDLDTDVMALSNGLSSGVGSTPDDEGHIPLAYMLSLLLESEKVAA